MKIEELLKEKKIFLKANSIIVQCSNCKSLQKSCASGTPLDQIEWINPNEDIGVRRIFKENYGDKKISHSLCYSCAQELYH